MRLSSPDPSESPPIPRRKNRRRVPPSPSVASQHLRNEPSSPYSPQPQSGAEDEDNAAYEANSEYELASYSDSHSFYPSSSPQLTSSPSSMYVNVAPLPVFRGDPSECPMAHLARFDRVCRANNATTFDTLVRIFPVTLDGDAALWYDLSVEPHQVSMSWHDIRSAFLEAFTPPYFADRARSELMSMRQKDGEGVNSYHLRLQWILKKWPDHGLPDTLLKGIFIDGLREDYQNWILPQQPETLTEAVGLALRWEQARSFREARKGNQDGDGGEAKCGFCDGQHEESGCEVKRKMRELWLRSKPMMNLVREGGDEEGKLGRMESMKRGGHYCQCWKHQCWKKYERTNSSGAVAVDENPANTAQ